MSVVIVSFITVLILFRNERAAFGLTAGVKPIKYTPCLLLINLGRKQYPRNPKDVYTSFGISLLFFLQSTILLFSGCIFNPYLNIYSFNISNINSACFLVTQWIIPSSAYLSHGQFGNFFAIQLSNT